MSVTLDFNGTNLYEVTLKQCLTQAVLNMTAVNEQALKSRLQSLGFEVLSIVQVKEQ
jgi:hypothetical protein